MLRFLSRYLALAGLLANLALVAFLLFWLTNKIGGSEAYRDVRRAILGPADGIAVTPITPVATGQINVQLRNLPVGVWHKIHQQEGDGPEVFSRQVHGGAAFDRVRGRIMLFGSDTHGRNWDNTVRFFDVGTLSWSLAYPSDPPDTYRVNADGIPVAGDGVERPWAMHTFDAVEFDPITDRLIVASHPAHMAPDKKWGVNRGLWRQIKRHPTWGYRVSDNRWEPIAKDGTSFFPYAATFDAYRRVMIGVKPNGFWELDVDGSEWRRVAKGAPYAWHNAAAFDSDRAVTVSFGTNKRSNDVWQHRIGEPKGRKMPTPGQRPPPADSTPLVYHPGIRRVVALVEKKERSGLGTTETWLYSTELDTWQQLHGAKLPFAIGMNYDLVYDPNHDLLVLVANYPREPTAVWALRINGR